MSGQHLKFSVLLYTGCQAGHGKTRQPWALAVWSAQVNRQVCELDVLGPDCEERRKACLEICSSLRRRLCLQA